MWRKKKMARRMGNVQLDRGPLDPRLVPRPEIMPRPLWTLFALIMLTEAA
jgi:hypothetical protein